MKMLSDKWSSVEMGIEKEKTERKIALEEKLRQIEARINSERPNEEAKFKQLRDQMFRL